jgi:hypothetical protein
MSFTGSPYLKECWRYSKLVELFLGIRKIVESVFPHWKTLKGINLMNVTDTF